MHDCRRREQQGVGVLHEAAQSLSFVAVHRFIVLPLCDKLNVRRYFVAPR